MESTDYRPQNVKNSPVLAAHCGDARGAYLYSGHAYNACNYPNTYEWVMSRMNESCDV